MYDLFDFNDGYYDSIITDVYFNKNANGKSYIGIKNKLSLNNKYVSTLVDFYYLNDDAISCTISRINDLLKRCGLKELEENETTNDNLYLTLRRFFNRKALVKVTTNDKYKKIKYILIV